MSPTNCRTPPHTSLGDRRGAPNTTALLGEVFLRQGGAIAGGVAAAGYPQPRSYSLVFAHIDTESGSRLTELAARTGVTPQSMSDVVTGMIRDGYLRRVPDPTDGRARLLQLTPRGQEAIDTGRAMIARLERWYHEVLGPDGLTQLRTLLTALRDSDPPRLGS